MAARQHRHDPERPTDTNPAFRLDWINWLAQHRNVPLKDGTTGRMTLGDRDVFRHVLSHQKWGFSRVSHARTAKETGVHERTVGRAMGKLDEFGLIFSRPRGKPGGGRDTNEIRVNWSHPYWAGCPDKQTGQFDVEREDIKELYQTIQHCREVQQAAPQPEQPPQPAPALPVEPDPPPTSEPSKPWSVATLTKLVGIWLLLQIHENEARAILSTCRRRKLMAYSPQAVLMSLRDQAKQRNGFDTYNSTRIRCAGAFVNAGMKSVPLEHVEKTQDALTQISRIVRSTSAPSGTVKYLLGAAMPPAAPENGIAQLPPAVESPPPEAPLSYESYCLECHARNEPPLLFDDWLAGFLPRFERYQCTHCQDSGWRPIVRDGREGVVKCDHSGFAEKRIG